MLFLIYLLKMSLSYTVLYSVYYVLLRQSTFHNWQRVYLLLIPVISGIIPLARFPETTGRPPLTVNLPELVVGGIYQADGTTGKVTPSTILLVVYGLGCLFMLVRLSLRLLRLAQICSAATFNSQLQLPVAEPAEFQGAGSFFNVLILAPGSSATVSPVIVEHERIHIRQKHWLDIVLTQLFIALNWFNPVSYALLDALRLQHEFIADQELCETGIQKHTYQQLLFAESFGNLTPFEIHSFSKPSYLKIRIMKLNQSSSAKGQLLYYLSLAPVVTALVFSSMVFSAPAEAVSLKPHASGAVAPGVTRLSDGNPAVQDSSKGKIYNQAEKNPVYPGGEGQLITDLGKNIHYPAAAKAQKVEGLILVNFIVEKDGSRSGEKVTQGSELGHGLPEAALVAIRSLKKFKPGMQQGEPVRVSYTMPVRFRLSPRKPMSTYYYLQDGKEISYAASTKINPDKIKSMNVLDEKEGVAKYGAKAASGAIELIMK